MLGYTSEELLTMNIAQLDAKRSPEEIKAAIRSKGYSNLVFETCYRRRDGSIIDIEISSSRVGSEEQLLIFNSARDITERKRTETALRESEARLNATIENAMDAVVQIDSVGIITGWSSQAEKIFGWSRTERSEER